MFENFEQDQFAVKKFDFLFTIISLIAAAVAGVGAIWVYEVVFIDSVGLPIRVGAAFLAFTVTFLLLMLLLCVICGKFRENVLNGKRSVATILLPLLGLCAAAGLAAGLFQWLYQQDLFSRPVTADAYVFIVDTSDSMNWNDEKGARYDAIDRLIDSKGEKFPYAVYVFDTELERIRPMATTQETRGYSRPVNIGKTEIYDILEDAFLEFQFGKWGKYRRIQAILITDAENGSSVSDTKKNGIFSKYTSAGIPISTVFISETSREYQELVEISEATGGIFAEVGNIEALNDTLVSVSQISYERSLLESRGDWSVLHILVRVLFLTLLSLIIGFGGLLAYGHHEATKLVMISTPIKGFLAAGLFEVLTELFPSGDLWQASVLFALLGLLLLTQNIYNANFNTNAFADPFANPQKNSNVGSFGNGFDNGYSKDDNVW